MAGNVCVYMPKSKFGQDLFIKLKNDFGYNNAAYIYNKVTHPEFLSAYKDSLTINEGVPTYESVMSNDAVINFIGMDNILRIKNEQQPRYQDTLDNTAMLIEQAHSYNTDKNNNTYIAYVDYDGDKLMIRLAPRSSDYIDIAENQYKIHKLNERISSLLNPIGITMSTLSQEEVKVGRVGLTDFNKAVDTANGLASMMYVANNMEGHKAISEEFSHFIIGVYRNEPLVMRSIALLKNEDVAREILGDQYDNVYAYHDGNMDEVAEEALVHIFRDTLINLDSSANMNKANNPHKNLFRRAIDAIVRFFKGYNPVYIKESIDYVNSNMSDLAKQIMNEEKKITKQDVKNAQRIARFNALSEKASVQIDVLRTIEERHFKNIYLQQNLDEEDVKGGKYKKRASLLASKIHKVFSKDFKEEETIAAIASFLNISSKELTNLYSDLIKIDQLSNNDRFILLRNVLYTLQSYEKTINELKDITESSYLNDEHIKNQKFVVGDMARRLKDFETVDNVTPIDTSKMSAKEIADIITKEAENWSLSKDEKYYRNSKTKEKAFRVTSMISAGMDEDVFDAENPWYIPSTNIGTGVDEFIRDFLAGKIKEEDGVFKINGKDLNQVYPNATKEALNELAKKLKGFQEEQKKKGITIIPRDVVVNGTITTMDNQGKPHKVNVAGTLDLLGYDNKGNWYVYDIKTFRSNIDGEKLDKYAQQVTLYKEFLEKKFGIKVKDVAILPVQVTYPTPKGFAKGKAKYTVSENKPEDYSGKKSNQLNVNGKTFKGANPTLQELKVLEPKKTILSYGDLGGESGNENVEHTLNALNTMDRLYREMHNLFNEQAPKYMAEYFKGFLGDNIKVREIDEKTGKLTGKLVEVSMEKLIQEAPKDTNLIQRWLLTMSDNPDAFMQVYTKIYETAMHEKRFKMIRKSQEILALGREFEKKGIRNYDWMFEKDKKNYIMHFVVNGKDYSYDKSDYEEAKDKYIKELNAKYGEFPEVGSQDFLDKNEALSNWIDANTIAIEVPTVNSKGNEITVTKTIPSPTKYPSKYNSLSTVQKDFYDRWISIKEDLDDMLPKDATHTTNTIRIRKHGYERLQSIRGGNPLNTFLEGVKARFVQSYDDENNYSKGIKGFEGEEVMKLPILYVNSKDTSDLTTDVIGSLIAYADMAYNYDAMSRIVNPLEIGRYLAKDRKVNKIKHGRKTFDEFSFGSVSVKNPLYEDGTSNFMAQLNDFMESKIYSKHLKDAGSFTVGKQEVENQKLASEVLKVGSTVQLGFNALAGFANIATGVSMQRIEAIAGEHFNMRELMRADAEFGKASAAFVGDIGQRIKKSKLALFDELFDVRQDYAKKIRHEDFKNKNLLLRIFGPNIQYICQDAGDHWLYNRSAIAIALRYKLKDKNGNIISLWDALKTEPIDKNNPELGNKLVLEEGVTKTDGTAFTDDDIMEVSNEIKYINQHCFGVYNQEDSVAARRTILGRFLLQYRDWIPSQLNYRWGAKTTNLNKGGNGEFEGYYRTFGRFIGDLARELKNGEMNLKQVFDELDDYEKANIKRALAEILQLISVYIIAGLLRRSKKKDREYSWARNALTYLFVREKTELGALVPGVQMYEMLNIVKSPFAATSVISDTMNLGMLLWPGNYMDEIQSGDFKGHSSAYRAFMRSPLTVYYRTIKRQLTPEKAEKFYGK